MQSSRAAHVDRGGHLWDKQREVTTEDGVRIRYAVRGRSSAPAIVLCAGFGCPDNFWWYLVPALEDRYRVIILNYRGVGASGVPHGGTPGPSLRSSDYTMRRHADDVLAVCAAEALDAATFIGHSMGCQVALEVFRHAPSRVARLVFVTGPYRSPLLTFYGSHLPPLGSRHLPAVLFPPLYLSGKITPGPLWRLIPRLARLPGMLDVAELVRAIGPDTPREPMQLYLDHFANLDAGVVLRVAKGMHRHSAEDLLPEVDRPALVITGSRDTFTPPSVGRAFVDALPAGELVEIPHGTHCAILEFPHRVNAAILDFLERTSSRDDVAASTS